MKKSIALVMALLISILSIPAVYAAENYDSYGDGTDAYSGSCGSSADWFYNEQTKELRITGSGEVYDSEENYDMRWKDFAREALTISIQYGITSICDDCFSGFSAVKVIELPNTLQTIGANAFKGTSVVSLTLPNSVTHIGDSAFYGSSGLKSVTLPEGLTYLGADAFSGCYGLAYNVTEGGSYLGSESNPYMAFIKVADSATTKLTFAEGVKFINKNAVRSNKNLLSVSIPEGIAWADGITFSGCSKLETVILPSDLQVICDSMFDGCKALSKIVIPESVITIGRDAFRYCTALSAIEIPDATETVGADAFLGCTALETVKIGKSLAYTERIFKDCTGVKSVVVSPENTALSYENGMIIRTGTAVDAFPAIIGENLVIPSAVKAVGDSVFEGFSLKSVEFPAGLEKIGNRSFKNCKSLTRISFPDSLTTIGISAFESCTGMEFARVGKSLKTVGASAFYNCKNLTEVEDCSTLSLKTVQGTTQYGGIVKYATNVISSSEMYFEENGYFFRMGDNGKYILVSYSGTEKNLVLPEKADGKDYVIGREAFANSDIESVVIPDTVREIGEYAFRGSEKLTHVTLGRGITSLCNNEFRESYVETVDMPNTVTAIYPTTFVDSGLSQINYLGTIAGWQNVEIDWERFTTPYDQSIYDKSALSSAKIVCVCSENGHTQGTRIKTASTCQNTGVEEVYCTVCFETLALREIPKGGAHTFKDGSCTACGAVLGDLSRDGKVNAVDAYLMKSTVLGLMNNTDVNAVADLNGDGKINVSDIYILNCKILGMIR